MPPKQSLSKGTLGLKFMNRALPPASNDSTPKPSTSASSSARSTPRPSAPAHTSTEKSTPSGGAAPQAQAAAAGQPPPQARPAVDNDDDSDWTRRTVGGARTVIHESSLLSFPLLSTLASTSRASTSSFTSTSATYSSMPLTAGAISGRRSYGGANVEIEKLNDPSSHKAPEPTAGGAGGKAESKSALKKRLKAERDAEPVSVRRGGGAGTLSGAKAGKRTAALDGERRGGAERAEGSKRRRTGELDAPGEGLATTWDGGEDEVSLGAGGFARPAGFEGARSAAKGRGKGKGRAGEGDALLVDEGEHRWGKRGETRAWDEDKMDDSDEEGASDLGGLSDEDADSDDDDMVEEVAPPTSKKGGKVQQKAGKTQQASRQEVERAIQRSEEKGLAGKASKKRR